MPNQLRSEEHTQSRRQSERFLFAKKQDAALRVCLVYPNRYPVAMGNLGFQIVYELFDRHEGVVCERAFLPDDGRAPVGAGSLRSFESGRPVADFDIVAFSISFESDYLHVIPLLELIGLPLWQSQRRDDAPLVMAGGPAVFLNPEPIADLFDLFLIGEAEEMLPEFLQLYRDLVDRGDDREARLSAVATKVAGAYVPSHYEPIYDGPKLTDLRYHGPATPRVERRLIWDLNAFETKTRVLSPQAVFGDMVLVEASRGCQWGCRFCAAGFMYRPIRTRDPKRLAESVREGLGERDTIGLIGAEMASVPGVDLLAELASASGGRLSPSSLKADCVTPRLASALAGGGTRSVTVAPEAGSERMRRVINKNLSEADILRATELLVGKGVPSLKLYFMFGLPSETEEDLLAIAELTEKIHRRLCDGSRERGRIGGLTVSINPFSPKPWTPFQWDPMEPIPSLKTKMRLLRQACRRVPNLQFDVESPREAYLSTLLSRGDRRTVHALKAIHAAGGDWWKVIRRWQHDGLDAVPSPDAYVYRQYDESERLPWDFIDHRIAKGYLWVERRKAFAARQTGPCDTATCHTCEAC